MKTQALYTEHTNNVSAPVELPLQLSEADETTQKTNEVGKATIGGANIEPTSGERVQAIDTKLGEIADLIETNERESYTNKLRKLIAQLLFQIKELAKTDRNALKELEKQYTEKNHESGELGRSIASQNLKFAIFTMVAWGAAGRFAPTGPYKLIAESFARDFSPQLGKIFEAELLAQQRKTEGMSQIIINKYQNQSQKGQGNSSEKQELHSILREVLQSRKEAMHG